MLVNQMHEPVGEAGREVRAEIKRAVLEEAARHVDARIFFKCRVADVRIRLVVPQQDIKLGLVPLDQIIFEGERLAFVIDYDIFEVGDFADERTRLRVLPAGFEEVGLDASSQRARFSDVENSAARILK